MRCFAAAILACLAQLAAPLAAAQEPPLPPGGVAPAPPSHVGTAPPRPMPVSLGLRLGMYDPSDDDSDSMMSIFDEGIDLEAAIGVEVHPNVVLEGAIGYYRTSSDRMSFYDPLDGTTMSAKFGLSVIPITASIRLGGQIERLSLYGLAGVGVHMASLEADAEITDSFGFTGSGTVSDDDTAFGFHLGAGASVQVSPGARVGVEIRRTFVDATLMDESVELGGLRIGATLAFRL